MKTATRQGRYGVALVAAVGVVGVAGLALVVAPGAARNQRRDMASVADRFEIPLAAGAELQILNAGGRISIASGDAELAIVTVTREPARNDSSWLARTFSMIPDQNASAEKPLVRETMTGVQVSTLGLAASDGSTVNYHIDVKLPRGRNVSATNNNGPIVVAGIDGDVSAGTENGDVRCEGVGGHVPAAARNGGVFCRYVSGGIDATASNGAVEIVRDAANGDAPVRVWTTNGPIRFRSPGSAMNLHAKTDNGRVVDTAHMSTSTRTLRTLDLNQDSDSPEVQLHALNGNIYVDAI